MHSIITKLFIGMAITTVGMFGADSSLGTWKFNPAKSKSTITNQLKSRTDVLEATPDGGVKVTRTEERADGTSFDFSFTFKYDGKENPVAGGQFDTISAKRINANTTTWEIKKTGGKYNQTSRWVTAKDGKTRTQVTKGTDAEGKFLTATYVYDKQ